jgi:sec-independent protein translocase protein TatC
MSQQTRTPKPYVPPPTPEDDGHELRMSLMDHLLELRTRLLRAVIALGVGVTLGIFVTEPVFRYLMEPGKRAGVEQLLATAPTDSILSYLRVSLLIGAIISIPIVTYQLLMFIVPGLTRTEKRIVISSIPAVTILFGVGVAFAWFVMIPPALNLLANFQSDIFEAMWTADRYLGFITALLFWMGVAFQTPLIFFVLSLLGVLTARVLIRQWRVAIVAIAAAAAIITPTPDPVNMLLVMAPLLVLYLFSILLTALGSRRFNRAVQG